MHAKTALFLPAMIAAGQEQLQQEANATELQQLFTHEKGQLHCPDRTLVIPCVSEFKAFLFSPGNASQREALHEAEALACAEKVYASEESDFNVLKNMTHLLLDLDTTEHQFDKQGHAGRFFDLGIQFGKKLVYHKDCLKEFDEKDELECRCPLLYAKIALIKLKNAERWDEAKGLFNELKKFAYAGSKKSYAAGEAFPWDNFQQTPQIWMKNLTNTSHFWPESKKEELPVWEFLERHYETIKSEALTAMNSSDHVSETYRFLFSGGNWNQVTLFSGREWNEAACSTVMKKTCDLLKDFLPKRKQHHLPWTSSQNEQVLILRMTKGTTVETHCGPANNILNVHLGISGCKGAELRVMDNVYKWEEGKVIAWDGSFDHSVNCVNCEEDRVIVMVRYMHPEVTEAHYHGNKKTAFEAVVEAVVSTAAESEAVGLYSGLESEGATQCGNNESASGDGSPEWVRNDNDDPKNYDTALEEDDDDYVSFQHGSFPDLGCATCGNNVSDYNVSDWIETGYSALADSYNSLANDLLHYFVSEAYQPSIAVTTV